MNLHDRFVIWLARRRAAHHARLAARYELEGLPYLAVHHMAMADDLTLAADRLLRHRGER